MTHNGATLAAAITEMSISDTWEAKFEWELEDVYKSREPEACLCGHSPIHELCYIRNKFNDNLALVGNVPVERNLSIHQPGDQRLDSRPGTGCHTPRGGKGMDIRVGVQLLLGYMQTAQAIVETICKARRDQQRHHQCDQQPQSWSEGDEFQ